MYTATLDKNSQTLELILLAIKIAAEDASHPFVKYLNTTLKEAKRILENPEEFSNKKKPEAFKFAYYLYMHQDLLDLLSGVETFEEISEDQVKKIICNRERSQHNDVY